MSITTLDQLIGAQRQNIEYYKTGTRTTGQVAGATYTFFDLAGQPTGPALAIGNTNPGIVPVDTDPGYWPINAFPAGGGVKGYLSRIAYASSVIGRFGVYDRIYAAGAYAFNAGTVGPFVSPSWASRVPGGNDYKGLEIWIEVAVAITSATTFGVTVTYTDQDGNGGATASISGLAAAGLTVGRAYQLPLAAGDSGLQAITQVQITQGGAAAGSINVMVLRPLAPVLRIPIAGAGDVFDAFRVGMPEVFADSAIYPLFSPDGTAAGINELTIEIASG
jgi:hypothetical protein